MPTQLLLAANWKMNPPPNGFNAPSSPYRPRPDTDVLVLPATVDLERCLAAGLRVGGQGARPEATGAFTGDVSMEMLKRLGCTHVLCGHSERRQHHGETDAFVSEQVRAALALDLTPIACVGETGEERAMGKEREILQRQLAALPTETPIIAYEPVWAIGTGKNATPAQAQEMHAFIRSVFPHARLLYGGSMNEKNALDLLSQKDVDGGLIGSASLQPRSFQSIIERALTIA